MRREGKGSRGEKRVGKEREIRGTEREKGKGGKEERGEGGKGEEREKKRVKGEG